MRNEFLCNQITRRSLERDVGLVLLCLLSGAMACSGFATSDCVTSRTCAAPDAGSPADRDGASAAGGSGPSSGGAAGAGGTGVGMPSGAPGATASNGSGGGTGGTPDSTSSDAGASDNNGGHSGETDGPDTGAGTVDAGSDAAGPPICTASRADCNGDRADGCEVDLSSSAAHCGACAAACSTAGASRANCVAGACKPQCDANHADCDGDPKNGCEVDIASDVNSCGACGRVCSKLNATATACVAGVCKPTCVSGRGDCSSPKPPANDDGCELDVTTQANCGACGHDCQGGGCQAGQCQPMAVLTALSSPSMIAMDAKFPYVLTFESGSPNGLVIRVNGVGDNYPWAPSDRIAPSALVGDANGIYLAYPSSAASGDPANGEVDFIATGIPDPVVLMSGIDPRGLAVDAKNIYWSDFVSNGVFRQSLGADKTVTQVTTTDSLALSLVSDGADLYAANSNGNKLFSVPVAGGALSQLTSIPAKALQTATRYVAVDAKYVYAWFYDTTGVMHLEQLTKPGLVNPREIATSTVSSITTPMAVDANYIYFYKDQGLYRAPTNTNGAPSLIQNAVGTIPGVAVSNGVLYWVDTGSSATDGRLYRLVL